MATSDSIITALVTAFRSIQVSGGYSTEIAPENVFSRMTPLDSLQKATAASYPRIFVMSEGATYSDLPANRFSKTEHFTVLAVFAPNRDDPADVAMSVQTSRFVDDMEVWVTRNRQMGGADLVQLLSAATDAETAATEAVAMFEISVIYKRSF